MMLDDEHITIDYIYNLQEKGLNMTLNEKTMLDQMYSMLPETQGMIDPKTKVFVRYNHEQLQFVRHVLLSCVKNKVPKLAEILAIYGLSMGTVFVWQDDRPPYTGGGFGY